MRYLQRIPLAPVALLLILLPMLVQLLHDWYALPLPYGTLIGAEDPDPWLRLTLVRDLLTTGDWYSHAVTHSDAPYFHTVSPWTRPLDVVIAFFVKLQPTDVDLSLRLIRAALILPVLWMGLLLMGIYRAVRQLTPLPVAPLVATVLVASVPVIRNYFGVGNADHHSMLAVVFIWAFGGILHRAPSPRLTIVTGMLLGLLLWISPEAMTLIAAAIGWYGMLWLWGDVARARPLPLLSLSITVTSAVAVMIERAPQEWLTPIYDSISIVYVIMLISITVATYVLMRCTLPTLRARALAGAVAVAAAAGVVLFLYPAMIEGPLTGLDPYIFSTFLPRIVETQPLFHKPALYVLALLLQPLAVLTFIDFAWRNPRRALSQQQLLQLGFFVLATMGLYLTQQRFYYYFDPVLIVALTPFLSALLTPEHPAIRAYWPACWLANLPPRQQVLRRLPVLAVILGMPMLLIQLAPSSANNQSRRIDHCYGTVRKMMQHGVLTGLADGKPLTVLMSTDLGGEALFFTPYRIIASNYHREGPGIRYIWEADDITDPVKLRAYLAMRKVDALLICPVAHPPRNSVLQRLQMSTMVTPSWLARKFFPLPPVDTEDDDDAPSVKGANPAFFLLRGH